MLQGAGDNGPGGDAGEDAFLVHQLLGHVEGVETVDQEAVVQQVDVEDRRNEPVFETAEAGDEIVGLGGDSDDLDIAAMLLETAGVAHERAARAQPGHEHIDFRQGLHDFLAGALVVRVRVAVVPVLVEHQVVVGVFLDHLLGHDDAAVGAQGAVRVDDLRAVGFQEMGAFHGDVLRHHHLDLVALEAADHCQGDAGVARGGLQDGPVGRNLAVGLCPLDHFEPDAVLDAAGGILALKLGVDADLGIRTEVLQFHQRGIADGGNESFVRGQRHWCAAPDRL